MRSGWVVGVGVGKVRGKCEESSSTEGLFSATEGILERRGEMQSVFVLRRGQREVPTPATALDANTPKVLSAAAN